jgi:hypothetical protein
MYRLRHSAHRGRFAMAQRRQPAPGRTRRAAAQVGSRKRRGHHDSGGAWDHESAARWISPKAPLKGQEPREDPPRRAACGGRAHVLGDLDDQRHAGLPPGVPLRVAVHVEHVVVASRTPIGPVPVGITQPALVRVEIAHVLGDQRAALETGRPARNQATFWIGRRELDGRAQKGLD